MAQMALAILFANAIAATRLGFLASIACSHGPNEPGRRTAHRITAIAPEISKRLISL